MALIALIAYKNSEVGLKIRAESLLLETLRLKLMLIRLEMVCIRSLALSGRLCDLADTVIGVPSVSVFTAGVSSSLCSTYSRIISNYGREKSIESLFLRGLSITLLLARLY